VDEELAKLLEPYAEGVRELTLRARAKVLEVMPEAVEQVDLPSRLVAFGTGPRTKDTVFTLMPQRDRVNLGVYGGAELPDPAGLLKGTGKRHRHAVIARPDDLDDPRLRALLLEAVSRKRG